MDESPVGGLVIYR